MTVTWNYQTGRRETTRGSVVINDYERGLLYRDGALQRVLGAGRYRLWPWQRARIEVVDVRRQMANITNQKVLTSDQITVTLNLVADYEIADAAAAISRVTNATAQLYQDVQLAARNVVGSVDIDTMLAQRLEINARLLEHVAPLAAEYGVRVLSAAVKDVILAPRVRDLLMKEVEARRVASAMLVGAREEVAAMRALANAARLAETHPALLRLRELDVARSMATSGGNTLVMGLDTKAAALRPVAESARTDVSEPLDESDE
jgi:regulator of protease activity HflC (stomatin/prohibitin superfamily)